MALAPAAVLSGIALVLNRFTLIDDPTSVVQGLSSHFTDSFEIADTGRVRPLFHVYNWVVLHVFPIQPWAFSSGNALSLLIAAALVSRVARRFGGSVGAVAAAWLFTLNLATVECMFTLSKQEPRQLVFWLGSLVLLARALDGGEPRRPILDMGLMVICAGGTVFFKETGLLLAAPLAAVAIVSVAPSTALGCAERRRCGLLIAAALPSLCTAAVLVWRHGLGAGAYGRAILAGAPGTTPFPQQLDPGIAMVLIGGLVGGVLLVAGQPGRRLAPAMLTIQLAALAGFFAGIRASVLYYYYYPALAVSAILLTGAVAQLSRRGPMWRAAAATVIAVLLIYGIGRSVPGTGALLAWGRLYDQLNREVIAAAPPRTLFHRAGAVEAREQARLWWTVLNRVPTTVGVLDASSEPVSRHLIAVSSRDLRPGDWILEQFGRVENRLVPFRDLNVSRPVDQGLMAPNGRSMLPLRLVRDFEASFPVPPTGFGFLATQRAGIRWRIYEVTSVPQFALEGLDADHWMHDRATLLVRRSGPVRVRARFAVFAPPGTDNNELTISAGGRLLQRCAAAREGLAECSFGVDTAAVGPDVGRPLDDWVALELRARHAFAPNQFGASRDTRALSFNFAESYGGGVWVWAGTGDQEPDPEASGVASVSAGR